MSKILFYDTETTGLPIWKRPSGGAEQPHIVQLAALLVDSESREVLEKMDVIVRPDGWTIPKETIDVHGITNERACAEGVQEVDALAWFLAMWRRADLRVAHNQMFDARIIRIATKRYSIPSTQDEWKAGPAHCTGLLSRPIMEMKPKTHFGWKMPKLVEAYRYFIGGEMENAHSAMPDAKACMGIYFVIQDR